MSENRNGQVVTFYSYKGGTGRTMALANVAWILAANGYRVLVVDWDLESPGLHRFFHPFIDAEALASTGGVIELIREFEWATTREAGREDGWHEEFARVQKYSFSLNWRHFEEGGTLDYLSAGRQNNDYAATLAGLNWDDFYDKQGGGLFFDALREDMKRHYDYTLIDSRTGLSDVADICTIHLPDVLVACFTLSEQGIDGAARVARVVHKRYESRNIRVLPVPMRIDPAEKMKADAGRSVAKQRFAGLPAGMPERERDMYWRQVQIPYQAFYAYEESLAAFGDLPGTSGTILYAYEQLTRYLTGGTVTSLPAMDETLRSRINARFVRHPTVVEDEVDLRYAPEDQVWAEWVEHILTSVGVRVIDRWVTNSEPDTAEPASARELTIISQANATEEATVVAPERGGGREPLAIYIADLHPLPNVLVSNSAFIAGLPMAAATERVLELVGRGGVDIEAVAAGAPRFPGTDPIVFNVPVRNARFTGRENDLRRLRGELRAGGTAVVLPGAQPVALQGMGGIGKTQVAMEYAHRFRASYDVVWWINADPVTFIESAMGDLGERLGIPMQTGPDYTRAVLQALSRGEPGRRWLLIFDNAEQPDRVKHFLPHGHGHVLITSRNPQWGDMAESIQVDVFARKESIAHLIQRVPTIKGDEANQVADMLGDLPIAVAAAGAWLADTGTPVAEYLREIERHGPGALVPETSRELSVQATWDLSLDLLRTRSPGAYRLLQLCSVLAPEIALDLVYSDELATALTPFDSAVSERLVRGSLVQQINRLALLRVDQRGERSVGNPSNQGGQILVHRVLQHVVRSRMSVDELRVAEHEVHLVLAAARPDGEVEDPDTWPRFRMLWPHLEASDAVNCWDEVVRRLLIDRIRYMWIHGDLVAARDRATRIIALWTTLLVDMPDSRDLPALRRQLLHLRFHHANVLRDLGLFEESRQINEAVLADQRDQLGEQHPHTLMTAGGLAGDLRGLGRYREAIELDQTTYAAWLELYGEDHPRTLTALSNLAVSHRLMGDFRAARDKDEIAYRRRRIVLSENHPNTLISATALGRDLRDAGEYERSVALLRTVADTYVDVWGADSRGALLAKANLAVSLRSAGRAVEAAAMLEESYEGLNESLGPISPDTLSCRLSRSLNLLAVRDTDRANRELSKVQEAYRDTLGPTHPTTLVCVNNLAMVARALGNTARARELATIAAADLDRVLGPDHPYTLAAAMNLAIAAAEEGDHEAALRTTLEAVGRITDVLGPDHPDTLRCRANLTLLQRTHGSSDPDLDEATMLTQLAGRIGSNHPAIVTLRQHHLLRRIIDPHPF